MSGVDVLGRLASMALAHGDDWEQVHDAVAELIEALKAAEQKLVELENLVGGGDDEIYVEGAILKARSALSRVRGAE